MNQKKVKKIRKLVRKELADGKAPFQAFTAVKEQLGQAIRRNDDVVKTDTRSN